MSVVRHHACGLDIDYNWEIVSERERFAKKPRQRKVKMITDSSISIPLLSTTHVK